jgi:hypothetical protein
VTYAVRNGTATGCALSGASLSTTSAGTCLVTAIMAGNANYAPVSSAETTVTLAPAGQAALSVTPTSGSYLSPLSLSTTGGTTGGPVTYAVRNGTATGCAMSGASLSSTSAGTCLVTATMAGNTNYAPVSSAETTVTLAPYTVSGVLQPINPDGSSIFKAARPIQVKFAATGPTGAPVTNLTASLSYTKLTNSIEGTYVEADTNVAATTGFSYNQGTGEYVYNWSTKGLSPGTYRILVTIQGGPTITATLSLR